MNGSGAIFVRMFLISVNVAPHAAAVISSVNSASR
jgi:hypothetical protein